VCKGVGAKPDERGAVTQEEPGPHKDELLLFDRVGPPLGLALLAVRDETGSGWGIVLLLQLCAPPTTGKAKVLARSPSTIRSQPMMARSTTSGPQTRSAPYWSERSRCSRGVHTKTSAACRLVGWRGHLRQLTAGTVGGKRRQPGRSSATDRRRCTHVGQASSSGTHASRSEP
jgi:hypothetical protein